MKDKRKSENNYYERSNDNDYDSSKIREENNNQKKRITENDNKNKTEKLRSMESDHSEYRPVITQVFKIFNTSFAVLILLYLGILFCKQISESRQFIMSIVQFVPMTSASSRLTAWAAGDSGGSGGRRREKPGTRKLSKDMNEADDRKRSSDRHSNLSRLGSTSNNSLASISSSALPWGDVNVLVVTDVHSWIAGHSGKSEYEANADYGDVLSFYERLKQYASLHDMDLWFVMNGDWIDGTGLATNGDASHLIPLIERMPFDIVTTGNHELYRGEVVHDIVVEPAGFIDWWGSRYISSNVRRKQITADGSESTSDSNYKNKDEESIGEYYQILVGKNARVLVFGFLYDMTDYDSQYIRVEAVEHVVNDEAWFKRALRVETYDAILVMAHMGCRDPLVDVILAAIRTVVDSVPVQFITGHTHVRDYRMVDTTSASFEASKFLDTIGFVSFPKFTTVEWKLAELEEQQVNQLDSQPSQQPGTSLSTTTPSTIETPAESPITATVTPTTPAVTEGKISPSVAPSMKVTETTTSPSSSKIITTTIQPTSSPTTEATNDHTISPTSAGSIGNGTADDSGFTTRKHDRLLLQSSIGYHRNMESNENIRQSAATVEPTSTSKNSIIIKQRDEMLASLFRYVFIDANVETMTQVLHDTLSDDNIELATSNGMDLSNFIRRVRSRLGLLNVVGCIPPTATDPPTAAFYVNRSVFDFDSLWRFFMERVVPHSFEPHHVVILDQGSWRYDLYRSVPSSSSTDNDSNEESDGVVILDDLFGVSPYNESFVVFDDIPTSIILKINQTINSDSSWIPLLPNYILAPASPLWHTETTAAANTSDEGDNTTFLHRNSFNDPNRSLVVDSFHATMFQQLLNDTYPNWTYSAGRTLQNITTTSIWIRLIQDKYPYPCPGSHKNNHWGNNWFGSKSAHESGDSRFDRMWMIFSGIAIGTVLILFAVVVYQRDRRYKNVTAAQEQIVLSAMEEYESNSNMIEMKKQRRKIKLRLSPRKGPFRNEDGLFIDDENNNNHPHHQLQQDTQDESDDDNDNDNDLYSNDDQSNTFVNDNFDSRTSTSSLDPESVFGRESKDQLPKNDPNPIQDPIDLLI